MNWKVWIINRADFSVTTRPKNLFVSSISRPQLLAKSE